MNMDFGNNKTFIKVIKDVHFEELILEIFILTLLVNDTKNHGKS